MMHVLQHSKSTIYTYIYIYKVVGRGLMKLYNFTGTLGTCVSDLKRAIKLKEKLPTAASLLKIFVGRFGCAGGNEVIDFKVRD